MNTCGDITWFNGNQDALNLYRCFVDIAHVWDDLRDKDKSVCDEDLDRAFYAAVCIIPFNPVFQQFQTQLQPLLLNAVLGYNIANRYEKHKDQHGLELGHTLRYSLTHVFMFLIVALNGLEKAEKLLPDALKYMVPERMSDYIEEHSHESKAQKRTKS